MGAELAATATGSAAAVALGSNIMSRGGVPGIKPGAGALSETSGRKSFVRTEKMQNCAEFHCRSKTVNVKTIRTKRPK